MPETASLEIITWLQTILKKGVGSILRRTRVSYRRHGWVWRGCEPGSNRDKGSKDIFLNGRYP